MTSKLIILLLTTSLLCCVMCSNAQNVGIGTTTPLQKLHVQGNTYIKDSLGVGIDTARATLHVNGTLRLKQGVVVNQVSADSSLSPGSDSILPTQKAVKRYIQKGSWAAPAGYTDSLLVWKGASFANLYSPQSVFVQGNYAYVASFDNNLLCIYDISTPEQIVPKGFITTNISGPTCVFVKGNYAYVTSYYNNNLSIYDISDPNTIVTKGFTTENLYTPFSLVVKGNYAYVASFSNDRLCVFDISNPDAIVAKGFISTNLINPISVFVQGNYAYVTAAANSRLCIYDISNPDLLVAKGYSNSNLSYPNSVFVQGNYAYVTSASSNALSVFDISNPDLPAPKGYSYTNLDYPTSVFVQGNYAYVSSGGNNRLCMFDISNPDLLVARGFSNKLLALPSSLYVAGSYIFVVSLYNASLSVFKKQLLNNSILTFSENGDASFVPSGSWAISGEDIYRQNGNVGIGTTTPTANLHLAGNQKIDSVFTLGFGSGMAGKEADAGKIGYQAFTPDALDIMGAGSNAANRKIKFWSEGGSVFTGSIQVPSGNVGIGTSSPTARLHVAGSQKIDGANTLEFGAGIAGKENNAGKIGYQAFSSDALDIVGAGTVGSNRKVKFWNEGGAVFIGALQAPAYTVVSDARFKKDIHVIKSPLEKLAQLRGVTYYFNQRSWSDYHFPLGQQYGFLAQEVEKVLPGLVATGGDGYKSVNYEAIIPLLTESVKVQQQQIQLLQQQIDELKALIGKK